CGALRSFPHDALPILRPSTALRGAELWLAVAAEPGRWTPASLRRALGHYFDPVVLPRRYRVVPRLPRDDLGKLSNERLEGLFSRSEEHTSERQSRAKL